jgi:hypothetical protein
LARSAPIFFAIYNSKIETYHGLVFVIVALMVSIAVDHLIDRPLRSGLIAQKAGCKSGGLKCQPIDAAQEGS